MADQMHDATVPLVRSNVIITDPRRLSREALQRLLEAASFTIIGEGKNLADVLHRIPPEARPDLIVHNFDSDDEVEQGLAQINEARAQFKGVKSAVLTDCIRTEVLLKVVQAGIEAILSKDISANVLQRALELVLLGQHMFPTSLAQMLLEPTRYAPGMRSATLAPSPDSQPAPDRQRATTLSKREHQILRCLVDGLPNKIIARELDITEATVKVHIKGLLRKTRMTNRTQAAIWALNNSLWSDPTIPDTGATPQAVPSKNFAAELTA